MAISTSRIKIRYESDTEAYEATYEDRINGKAIYNVCCRILGLHTKKIPATKKGASA